MPGEAAAHDGARIAAHDGSRIPCVFDAHRLNAPGHAPSSSWKRPRPPPPAPAPGRPRTKRTSVHLVRAGAGASAAAAALKSARAALARAVPRRPTRLARSARAPAPQRRGRCRQEHRRPHRPHRARPPPPAPPPCRSDGGPRAHQRQQQLQWLQGQPHCYRRLLPSRRLRHPSAPRRALARPRVGGAVARRGGFGRSFRHRFGRGCGRGTAHPGRRRVLR